MRARIDVRIDPQRAGGDDVPFRRDSGQLAAFFLAFDIELSDILRQPLP